MCVSAARRVVVCESINQADLRASLQNRLHVNDRDTFDVERGNDFKRTQKGLLYFRRNFRLQSPNHHILPTVAAPPTLVEHAERFAYAGCVAKKNLEAAPSCV